MAPKKVDNSMASWMAGSSRRRLIVLLDQLQLREFGEVDDILREISHWVPRVVSGVVEIRFNTIDCYLRVTTANEEFVPLLRNIGSAVASDDGVERILWRGQVLSPRPWRPYYSIRRRGSKAWRRFQRERRFSNEHMNKITEIFWRMYTLSESTKSTGDVF